MTGRRPKAACRGADDAGSRRNEAYYHTICSLYEKNTICILRFAKEKPLASRIDV